MRRVLELSDDRVDTLLAGRDFAAFSLDLCHDSREAGEALLVKDVEVCVVAAACLALSVDHLGGLFRSVLLRQYVRQVLLCLRSLGHKFLCQSVLLLFPLCQVLAGLTATDQVELVADVAVDDR